MKQLVGGGHAGSNSHSWRSCPKDEPGLLQEVRAVKDDADGERLSLVMRFPDRTLTLAGLHPSATPQQLDGVLRGAERAVRRWTATAPEDDGKPVRLPFASAEGSSCSSESTCVQVTARPSLKQWHGGACGFHALYNARRALYGAVEGKAEEEEEHFWEFVFTRLEILKAHREANRVWQSTRLELAILDEIHIQVLIDADPLLRNACTVIESPRAFETALTTPPVLESNERHAFVFACSSHWIAGCLTGPHAFDVFDSHNKPLASLTSNADSLATAERAVEAYRAQFISKMKDIDRYQHYPDHVLSRMYDEGVPEYWRGEVKDSMWWLHRPYRVRVGIVFREVEKARRYVDIARRALALRHARCHSLPAASPPPPQLMQKPASAIILPRYDSTTTSSSSNNSNNNSVRRRIAAAVPVPGVFTDMTSQDSFLQSYVRRDEYLEPTATASNPPPTLANRKQPPLAEIKGDVFDRQRVIPGFDQGTVERQVCLVVGTGGIGMNVALTLARLGVQEIIMVDYDVYDASNLTRQCLGTRSDVGMRKTTIAARNIDAHNLRSIITTLEADVLREWAALVRVAKRCSVVFNCCDAGLMFDCALNALAKELRIPLVIGQSFGWKFLSEFYDGSPDHVCQFCTEGTASTFSAQSESHICEVFERWCAFAARTDGADSLSLDAFDAFLAQDAHFRIVRGSVAKHFAQRFESEVNTSVNTIGNQALFTSLHRAYFEWCVEVLAPGRVSHLADIGFVPRPETPSTRFIGSWICPCLACSVICVSHWANFLTGPVMDDGSGRNPPTSILFNMDEGQTAEESMAYQTGMTLNREDRTFANSPSHAKCACCSAARALRDEERVFWGEQNVYLRPCGGSGGHAMVNPQWEFDTFLDALRGNATTAEGAESRILLPAVPALDPKYIIPASSSASFSPNGLGAEGWASDHNEEDNFGAVCNGTQQTTKTLSAAADPEGNTRSSSSSSSSSIPWPSDDLGFVPLVKTTSRDAFEWPGSVQGIGSGVRSCIVRSRTGGKMYRLKGCGNLDQGFPLEVKGDDGCSLSLRGCMFESTCARELFMTDYLNQVCHIECGNRSVGFFRYPDRAPRRVTGAGPFAWECPEVDKYCGVFETIGEKRLGDHLLVGLERLMARTCVNVQTDRIRQCLARNNRGPAADDHQLSSTATLVESGMDSGVLVDALALWMLDCADGGEWWDGTAGFVPGVVLQMAWRLGFECGEVLRSMHTHGVCWGTYPDKMGIHCNAHANNFVVRAAGSNTASSKPPRLLAPVDLDMAFTQSSFIEGCWEGKETFFPRSFEGILEFEEKMGMRTSLAGSSFTNTGVSNGSDDEGRVGLVRVLLRDTLVVAFDTAMRGGDDVHAGDFPEDEGTVRRIVALALRETADVSC